MKKYSIFHPYIMSFFSKSLYRDVGQKWHGIGAFYLLVLLLVCWIPVMVMIDRNIDGFISEQAPQLVNQVPTVTIKDGKLSIDKPVPYIIRDKDSKQPVVIIDTSGQYKSLEDIDTPMLVTSTQIFMRKNTSEVREYEVSKIPDLTFGKPQVNYLLGKIATWGAIFLFPFVLIATFIYRIIQALLYGAIGMLFSAMTSAKITYQQSLRLSIIAMTPAIILATIFNILHIGYPYELLSYFILTMIYLFFGVKANKNASPIMD